MEQERTTTISLQERIQETLRSIGSTPTSRPETEEKAEKLLVLYETPGNFVQVFGDRFLDGFLNKHFEIEEIAFQEAFPSLETVEAAFGTDTVLYWLRRAFVSFTTMWAPAREKNEALLNDLARIILADGRQLNVGEVCLFITWLKGGRMGNLYDASPVRIATAFQQFLEKRKAARAQVIAEQREKEEERRREEQRRLIDSPEHCEAMARFWDRKGDRKSAEFYRARLSALKGGAL